MATVVNFNYPKFKYTIASTGEPGAGYQLFTYEEGTSTKKATWTSLDKSAENANPVILDASGEADVWIDGNYKFVLTLPDDTDPPSSPIWTYDAIRSSESTSASSSEATITPINGSFETDADSDGSPDNWAIAELSGGTVAIDDASSTHGVNSLKFTSTGSGAGSSSTDEYYEVEADKDVGVRFSIISDDVDTLNKVQVFWYDSSQIFLSSSDAYNEGAANPTVWTRKYPNVTAPATAKYARIVLTGVDAASTTHSNTWFDNIELDAKFTGELTSTPTELNYVTGVTSSIQTQLNEAAPAGAVLSFAMDAAPSGWLEADGTAVSRTTYATLFAAIGVVFGVGDGSTTFNLPELRGEFVRGWDDGRGVDTARVFGSAQSDELKAHTHTVANQTGAGFGQASGQIGDDADVTGSTGGTETRPRNIALLYCIKY